MISKKSSIAIIVIIAFFLGTVAILSLGNTEKNSQKNASPSVPYINNSSENISVLDVGNEMANLSIFEKALNKEGFPYHKNGQFIFYTDGLGQQGILNVDAGKVYYALHYDADNMPSEEDIAKVNGGDVLMHWVRGSDDLVYVIGFLDNSSEDAIGRDILAYSADIFMTTSGSPEAEQMRSFESGPDREFERLK